MSRTRDATRTREVPEIKMFISQPEIDEVMKKDDNATAYIIQQNSVLVQRNMDLNKQCDELEKDKDELESYNDRLEKTRTCLQGYVRNEHDMALKYRKLYEYQKNVFNLYHEEFVYTQFVPLIIFLFGLLVSLYRLNYVFVVTIYIGFGTAHCTLVYGSYIHLHKIRNKTEIKDILEDIAKTKQSNSYIDDLIDNM